jgi:hypothetical protein
VEYEYFLFDINGKQEFRRTDFGSRVWVGVRGVSEVKQYLSGSG